MEVGQLNKKIGFIIQARMKSSRLPGKILLPLPLEGEIPLLGRIVNSLRCSNFSPTVIIATSKDESNDLLEEFCEQYRTGCFRGSENDVLSRFQEVQKESNFDVIVRLTGDNPLIDIDLLDISILSHIQSGNDYTQTKELPLGMNFEIFNGNLLTSLPHDELSSKDKEHVTLFIKRSGKYKLQDLPLNLGSDYSNLRLTIDYPSDFLVISTILNLMEKFQKPVLRTLDEIMERYPWILKINRNNFQKKNFKTVEEELECAKHLLKESGFQTALEKLESND